MANTAPSRGIKHQGSLTRLGYREHESPKARHRALNRAVRRYGYKKTVEKVNDLAVLNKHQNREFERALKSDMNFLREHHKTPEPMRRR
jgi:hypothetical protein